jgi:hypothetical protein
VLGSACADPNAPAVGPNAAAPDVRSIEPSTLSEHPSVVLAQLELSPTHHIELRELSDMHGLAVVERLNADRDKLSGNLTKGFDPRRQTTVALYRSLVQQLPANLAADDVSQLARLSDFDARSGAVSHPTATIASSGVGATSQALNNFFPDEDPTWFTHEFTQGVLFNQCEATDVNCGGIPMLALLEPDCGSIFSPCTQTPAVQRITAGPREVVSSLFWTFSDEVEIAGGAWADSEDSGWGSQYSIFVIFD